MWVLLHAHSSGWGIDLNKGAREAGAIVSHITGFRTNKRSVLIQFIVNNRLFLEQAIRDKRNKIAWENGTPPQKQKFIPSPLPLHKDRMMPAQTNEFLLSREWQALRYDIIKRDGGLCQACGRGRAQGVMLHVDHIVPMSVDPSKKLDRENLQTLCEDCNMGKGNRDDTDWRKHNGG